MARIFISFSMAQQSVALAVANELLVRSKCDVFMSSHPESGLVPGDIWQERILEEIDRSELFIPIVTDGWGKSKWCFAEAICAISLGKKIVPIQYKDTARPDILSKYQFWNWSGDESELVHYCKLIFKSKVSPLNFPWEGGADPFPGLNSFDEDRAGVFFGRDLEISKCIEKLSSMSQLKNERILIVSGASGCGKSSFIKAGLIPNLEYLRNGWKVARPDASFDGPAASILGCVSKLMQHKDVDISNYIEAIKYNQKSSENYLIVLDQFEENLDSISNSNLSAFSKILHDLFEAFENWYILIGVRGEFIPAIQNSKLSEHSFNVFSLAQIPIWNIRPLIEGPASRSGFNLEVGLVDLLLDEFESVDALPLLAFTLSQFSDKDSGVLSKSDYISIGRISGSIQKTINSVLEEMISDRDTDLKTVASELRCAIFPWFVRWDQESRQVVRRRSISNYFSEKAEYFIGKLVNARILVSREVPGGGVKISFAHESLLKSWPMLKDWVDEEIDRLKLLETVLSASQEWGAHSFEEDSEAEYLVHAGRRLSSVEEMIANFPSYREFIGEVGEAYVSKCREIEKHSLKQNDREMHHAVETLRRSQERVHELAANYEQEKIRAVEANRSKSEFLANMSHELRTPLNAMVGFSEIMAGEMFGPLGHERYQDYVRDILSSGQHLLSLINDILDMSKIEAGKMQLQPEPLLPSDVIEQCVRIMRARAEEKSIQLTVEGDELPEISADPRALKQVLLNLMSNAVKFTPEGGKVKLRGFQAADGVVMQVSDTGIGIAEDDLLRVGRPFEQIESQHSKKHQGSGLGLALSKSLIELHGGALRIDSKLGEGTTVSFTLPNV